MEYDTSIVFQQHSGFRYGICSPYFLYDKVEKKDIKVLQLPPTVMDDHLFTHANNTKFKTFEDHIDSLVDTIYKYQGILMVDFHVRVLIKCFFQNGEKLMNTY